MSEHTEDAVGNGDDTDVSARIETLRRHMNDEGESVDGALPLDGEYVFDQKMKLTWHDGDDTAFVVPSDQDFQHDALDAAHLIAGTFYAFDEAFIAGSVAVTGYFQADDTQRWARVDGGSVALGGDGTPDWKESPEDFPEVVEQFVEAMDVSEYRHVVEQAEMKHLVERGED